MDKTKHFIDELSKEESISILIKHIPFQYQNL